MTINEAFAIAFAHHQSGRLAEAEGIYWQILAVDPRHFDAVQNLGVMGIQCRRYDIAVEMIRRAIAVNPYSFEAHSNLGDALRMSGELDGAIAACRQSIALNPAYTNAYLNLAIALVSRGDWDEGIAAFRRSVELNPTNAAARDGLGQALLTTGHFEEGWRELEWRWKKDGFEARRLVDQPQWDGSSMAGLTIRLQVEQGYGDVFQFCRYASLLAGHGAKVVLESVGIIHELLGSVPGVGEVVNADDMRSPFDVVCPLLSLPMRCGTRLETIPVNVPYLSADPRRAQIWNDRLRGDPSFKVGIVWAGRPTHSNDHNRSLKLAALAPLGEVPGVRFFSLQKGEAAAEGRTPPVGMAWTDVAEELNDFSDTAALIANLDLVIAVDTAVVHLAGAMGKPVWTLLPFAPDWRWLLERKDSPWYPTMRLFRQGSLGDWGGVIAEVLEELRGLVRARGE